MTNISVELYFPILDLHLPKELSQFWRRNPNMNLMKAYLYTGRRQYANPGFCDATNILSARKQICNHFYKYVTTMEQLTSSEKGQEGSLKFKILCI